MSSTNKTENYSLNQWVLSDVPKMEDFNSDNKTIDTVMFKHISDSIIHLSEEEKQAVVNPLEMYTYHGDGTASRDIDLPFTFEPRLCIVFVVGAPLGIIDISNQVEVDRKHGKHIVKSCLRYCCCNKSCLCGTFDLAVYDRREFFCEKINQKIISLITLL